MGKEAPNGDEYDWVDIPLPSHDIEQRRATPLTDKIEINPISRLEKLIHAVGRFIIKR